MNDTAITEKKIELMKVKRSRPDGSNGDEYKNLEKWSMKRWAWEFLRRSPDYREACAHVKSGTDEEKQAIAEKFGLRKFKHWNEKSNVKLGYPKFLANPNKYFSNSDCVSRTRSIRMNPGQIVFVFDLTSEISGGKSLSQQLLDAKDILTVQLKHYAEKNPEIRKNNSLENLPRPQALNFGLYIRIIDCLDSGMSKADCARKIFENRAKEDLTDAELGKLLEDPIIAAKKYLEHSYLHLSKFIRRPNSKKKITTTR